jgi:GTP-binding protein
MSKQEKEKSGQFIEQYILKSKNISLICFLLDIRHTPTSNDKLMYQFLFSNHSNFIIIANKADKIAPTKVETYVENIKKELNVPNTIAVLPFSSERKIYTENVWDEILS